MIPSLKFPFLLLSLLVLPHTPPLIRQLLLLPLSFILTQQTLPHALPYLEKKLFGYDLHKPWNRIRIPESSGIVPATISILILYTLGGGGGAEAIAFGVMLGYVDDTLDLPWRCKIVLPIIGVMPLLTQYTGSTYIRMLPGLNLLFGDYFDLGIFYYVYMVCLCIFCTNSINIYAGINGLEITQSIVIQVNSNYCEFWEWNQKFTIIRIYRYLAIHTSSSADFTLLVAMADGLYTFQHRRKPSSFKIKLVSR